DRRRPRHALALRAAQRPRAQRRQVRLRRRPMRRLHGAARRQAGLLVPRPGRSAGRAQGEDARRLTQDPAGRVRGRAGGAMRLLHRRHDRPRAGAARAQSTPDRARDAQPHGAQPLPLRYPHAHPARGAPRRRGNGWRRAGCGGAEMKELARRAFLANALVVTFALSRGALAQDQGKKLPQSLAKTPELDAWIRVGADGTITVFTGKAELGQGIRTALTQVAAQELAVLPEQIDLVTADTARTPDEGVTAGSHSMQDSGTAILNAAANVRALLADAAAWQFAIAPGQVEMRDGAAHAPDGRQVGYGELASSLSLEVEVKLDMPRRQGGKPVIGQNLPRLDIPAKVSGGETYVQDMRLPGMLHARVVRGPSDGTKVKAADIAAVEKMPGVVKIVRDGGFMAVIANHEWRAVKALHRLQAGGWERTEPPIPASDLRDTIHRLPAQNMPIFDYPGPPSPADARSIHVRYSRPHLMHGSIGPSCAMALWENEGMTVWTHSQGVYPLRKALAELLKLDLEKVR